MTKARSTPSLRARRAFAAEVLTREELREACATARERGLLDMDALRRSRDRVEWRPSLAMLDEVMAEFD